MDVFICGDASRRARQGNCRTSGFRACEGNRRMLNYRPFVLPKSGASVAQLVEQFIRNERVTSSSLVAGSIFLVRISPSGLELTAPISVERTAP